MRNINTMKIVLVVKPNAFYITHTHTHTWMCVGKVRRPWNLQTHRCLNKNNGTAKSLVTFVWFPLITFSRPGYMISNSYDGGQARMNNNTQEKVETNLHSWSR